MIAFCLPSRAQRVETVPFGDFERWTTRHIKESAIIGGEVKTIYVLGPQEIIEGNKAYDYSRTPWASSNAYAKVSGVTKTSLSAEPDNGPSGKCAKLSTVFASCKVAGLVDIQVLATGALYWGKMFEPITGVKNPYAKILKKQITIRLNSSAIDYFKNMAKEVGIPYQVLIDSYLTDCAISKRRLNIKWQ